jgi:hypothetical protein
MATLVPYLAALVLALAPDGGTPPLLCTGQAPGDAEAKDARRFLEDGDEFYVFAVSLWGAPVSCKYEPEPYEGQTFHKLEYRFAGGGTLSWQTMPPETSIIRVSAAKGFPDEKAARKLLADSLAQSHLNIAWDRAPEVKKDAKTGTTTKTYWDPEAGLNVGADLVYRGKRLVGIGYHAAL